MVRAHLLFVVHCIPKLTTHGNPFPSETSGFSAHFSHSSVYLRAQEWVSLKSSSFFERALFRLKHVCTYISFFMPTFGPAVDRNVDLDHMVCLAFTRFRITLRREILPPNEYSFDIPLGKDVGILFTCRGLFGSFFFFKITLFPVQKTS